MKKQDLWPIIIIVALFILYPMIDRKFVAKMFPARTRPVAEQQAGDGTPETAAETTVAETPDEGAKDAELVAPAVDETAEAAAEAPQLAAEASSGAEAAKPEQAVELANEVAKYVLTTKGAGVKTAIMISRDEADATKWRYPLSAAEPDQPVTFDFAGRASGAISGLPGAGASSGEYELVASDGASATFERHHGGLVVRRRITLGDGYQLAFEDELRNESDSPVALKDWGVQLGWMPNLEGEADARMPALGIDTLLGGTVKFWSGKFEKWFPAKEAGDVQTTNVPLDGARADWLAVKNKYFAQLLHPSEEGVGVAVRALARRGEPIPTRTLLIFPSTAHPFGAVAGEMRYDDMLLGAGETAQFRSDLYIGPKLYQTLAANGYHEEDILQLGFWRIIGIWILKLMVWLRDTIWPYNYGLSIILLTVLIRIIFWPLNHKSMASTQRMQEIQPQLAAVREKFKNDPQRQQAAMMQLYKENHINPMGGCLPMLIQIPVFFALFVVLRGAIELRFSSFLWIHDLSTPENVFRVQLGFGVNILPIVMGLTMWWQQRMTPTSDPSQQKMMLMMPILFTVLFYSFPSGLSLYWTTNQLLMIVQQTWMKRHKPAAPAAAAAAPAASATPPHRRQK